MAGLREQGTVRGRADQDETVFVVRRPGRETVSRAVRERDPRMSGQRDGAPGRAVDRILRGRRPAGVGHQQRTVLGVSGGSAQIVAFQDIRGHHVRDESRFGNTDEREYTHLIYSNIFCFFFV